MVIYDDDGDESSLTTMWWVMMTMMTMWWVADPGLSGLITLFTASASHTQIVMTRMIMMVGRRIMMMVILKVVPHKI